MAQDLPITSTADFKNGIWMVFTHEKYIVRVWMSLLNGKEIIYINDQVHSQKRNLTSFNTVDSFDQNGDHFDIEIDTESLMPYKINCTVFINGQWQSTLMAAQTIHTRTLTITEEDKSKSVERMLNRFLQRGKTNLKEFDLEHAVLNFDKALMIQPDSSEAYYYKACISSLNENAEAAFDHLEKAISCGLKGQQRILDEGYFAYIRITKAFDEFKAKHFA